MPQETMMQTSSIITPPRALIKIKYTASFLPICCDSFLAPCSVLCSVVVGRLVVVMVLFEHEHSSVSEKQNDSFCYF